MNHNNAKKSFIHKIASNSPFSYRYIRERAVSYRFLKRFCLVDEYLWLSSTMFNNSLKLNHRHFNQMTTRSRIVFREKGTRNIAGLVLNRHKRHLFPFFVRIRLISRIKPTIFTFPRSAIVPIKEISLNPPPSDFFASIAGCSDR